MRTLQFYDRIGLLVAGRDGGGRRRYTEADLDRLLHIQLLTRTGFSLAEAAELLCKRADQPLVDAYADQLRFVELAELRLRHQRAVLGAIVTALREDGAARLPANLIAATLSLDDTMLRYPDLDTGVDAAAFTPEQIDRALTFYLGWKAVAVRALIHAENGVEPGSAAGRRLGQDWLAVVSDATSSHAAHERAALESMRDLYHLWPVADRELHQATGEYLDRCEQAMRDHAAGSIPVAGGVGSGRRPRTRPATIAPSTPSNVPRSSNR